MPYTPDADVTAEPVSSRFAGSAASEFRTLKTRLQQTIRLPESEGLVAEMPAADLRKDHILAFNPISGAPEPSPLTVTDVSEALLDVLGIPPVETVFQTQVATAGQTVFTLAGGATYTPNTGNLHVYVNGVRQYPSDVAETSTTQITFTSGLTLGDEVLFEIGRTVNAAMSASSISYDYLLNYAIGTIGYKLNQGLTVADFKTGPSGIRSDADAFLAAVAHAMSLVDNAVAWNDRGADVVFPPGKWDLRGAAVADITTHRICIAAAGALGTTVLLCDGPLINYGDYTKTRRLRPGSIENLVFYNSDPINTDACITLYRTSDASITNCRFINWYIGIDCFRASTTLIENVRWAITDRTTSALAFLRSQGTDDSDNVNAAPETYCPGGGFRISNVDLTGSNVSVDTTHAFLLKSCDGFYLTNSHIVTFESALTCDPDGTPENHVIIDIRYSNCYFDAPSGFAAAPYNLQLVGNVSDDILLADGVTTVQSIYRDIWGEGTKHEGANLARYCVFMQITDLDTWATTATQKLDNIKILGGIIRHATRQGIQVSGASSGAFVEPRNFHLSNIAFEGNNSAGNAGVGSDINVHLESGSIVHNSFSDPDLVGADFTINAVCSDAGATDNPNPSVIVAFNDLSKLTIAPLVRHINVTQSDTGNNVIINNNMLPGVSKDIDQVFTGSTSAATTITLFEYTVPDATGGSMTVEIRGTNGTGGKHVTYFYRVGFRKTGGTLTLSTGTSTFSLVDGWNPDAFATPPVAEKAGDILRVQATGIAAQNINWTAHVKLGFSR